MRYEPRDYQVEAIGFLLRKPFSGLFLNPGHGKTGITLAAYHLLKKKRMIGRMLVLAPLNPVYNTWPAEVEKWGYPYSHAVLHGPKKDEIMRAPPDLSFMNYEGLRWLVNDWLPANKGTLPFDWLVLDESSKVKNTNTERFKLLKQILPKFRRRTLLTGTPAPNGLQDLFGQIYSLDGGLALGRYITQYRRRYFYQTGFGGYKWLPNEGADKEIADRIAPLVLRFDDSVLKLPSFYPVPLRVRLPDKAARTYRELHREFIAEVDSGTVTAVNAGAKTQKLRQVAAGSVYDDDGDVVRVHQEKARALADLVDELQGQPLLVGYEFTHDMEAIKAALGDVPHVGKGVTAKRAQAYFSEFNDGKHPVLLAQSAAAAHGLNLQDACHHLCWYTLPWNYETYYQFNKRIWRSGQRHTCLGYTIIARDTVDEAVLHALSQKRRTQAAFFKDVMSYYKARGKKRCQGD